MCEKPGVIIIISGDGGNMPKIDDREYTPPIYPCTAVCGVLVMDGWSMYTV